MKKLQAGSLTAGYENGFLRRIAYGETEVLQMIYFALRDHNWNTLQSEIQNEDITIDDDTFHITYDCFNVDGGVTVMQWRASINGKTDGTITFEINGKANEDFKKNRAGFCILHPLNITGELCTIAHPDETISTHEFPVDVSPENPFKNIQSMTWQAAGTPFELVFEGEIFETEDQRNWSDASFKTFCTPLDRPFPILLKRGAKIFQRVTFRPKRAPGAAKDRAPYITLTENRTSAVFPVIGVAASTEHDSLSEKSTGLLRHLNLRHYRIDLYPGQADWVTGFSNAYETGFSLGLPLEAVLHLTDNFKEDIESFIILCKQNKVKLRKVLLLETGALVTGQKIINEIPAIKNALPGVAVGAGTNYNFNEINKNRFDGTCVDFISFSIDPQEHAFDNITILENMEAQQHLVRSAKVIYGERMPVHISPLTLRKRFNPYATNPSDFFIEESLKADPRQKEVFAALWTLGSLRSLSEGGAQAVTLFQTTGGQGILSGNGEAYPVYDLLKGLAPFQGKTVKALHSSDLHSVQGMLLDGKVLVLVNFTESAQSVRMADQNYLLDPFEIKFKPLNRT